MSVAASAIPELEEIIRGASPDRRAALVRRVSALFLEGAGRFNDDHVKLFDHVLTRLIGGIDSTQRAELSQRLASVTNAPIEVVRQLAHDDVIEVARPVLEASPRIPENDLVYIARSKSQAHLLAIAARRGLCPPVTELLLDRGNGDLAHALAENHEACLTRDSFRRLAERARTDPKLAERLAARSDFTRHLLPELASQKQIAKWHWEGEAAIVELAKGGNIEQTVVALACICDVPREVVERILECDRLDPVLVLCKAAGWGWPTVKAIITARCRETVTSHRLDAACADFESLSPATARRVMRFWQVHAPDGGQQSQSLLPMAR